MEILSGQIVRNETTAKAMGGTELMAYRLASLTPSILEPFQIIFSRARELSKTKLRVLYLHDLVGDPESDKILKNEGWRKFHKLVFVSNWQMQQYINAYGIPWAKCLVMQNAIEPFEPHEKPTDRIRLAYWSTPHRGLNILLPVFDALAKEHDDIELMVCSSFGLYGWEQRDAEFTELLEFARNHERIIYKPTLENAELRKELESCHILAYPSTWPETSCLVLMEAMSAGMLCVHSNYAALPETAANWTTMYQFNEDQNEHAGQLYFHLDHAIKTLRDEATQTRLKVQKTYADVFYNWEIRRNQWEAFLTSDILQEPVEIPEETREFFSISRK